MGLGSFLIPDLGGAKRGHDAIVDPGDVLGGLSGETGRDAAAAAADITNEELRRQFALSQENLRPALEASQRTLPGLESQLTPGGFTENIQALLPELQSFLGPTQQGRITAGSDMLRAAGLDPSAGIQSELGKIDPATMADLLLGAEADLFGNRLGLTGLGEGAGTVLSELGQRTGAGIAQSNVDAQLAGQQATAGGQQNALALASLAASFFSDERLKDDIEELGQFKGLRIIRWKWRDFVPESWRDITVGFSAQDVLNQYPEFVTLKHNFLAIDRQGLMQHLGMNHGN